MEPWEILTQEIDSIERQLSRRSFFLRAAVAMAAPRSALGREDREFLDKVAKTLIPAEALRRSGVDIVANIERLLERGSAEHRAKVLRLVAWARRVSFLYGGEQTALRARSSRFALMQRMSKALSALCLVAFWGDERTLDLIETVESAK